jgi:hypothetical protein
MLRSTGSQQNGVWKDDSFHTSEHEQNKVERDKETKKRSEMQRGEGRTWEPAEWCVEG